MTTIELILAAGLSGLAVLVGMIAAAAARHDNRLKDELANLKWLQRSDDQWLRNKVAGITSDIDDVVRVRDMDRKIIDGLQTQFNAAKQTFTKELESLKHTTAKTFHEGERLLNGFQAKLSEGERRLKEVESRLSAVVEVNGEMQSRMASIERSLNILQASVDASDAIVMKEDNASFRISVSNLLEEVRNIQAQQTKVFGEIVETYRKGEVNRAQQANDVGVFEKRLDAAVEMFTETRNLVKTLTAMVVEHIAEKQKTEDDLPELERVLQAWGKAPQPGVRPSVRKLGDELDVAEAKERSEIAEVSNMTSVTMKARPLTDEEARIVAGYATDYRHDIERTTGPGMRRVYDPTRDYRLPVNTKHGMCIVCGAGFEQTAEEKMYCEQHAVTHYPGPREG